MSDIPERLTALRGLLREQGLSHYLVPGSDAHLNEYVPPWSRRRTWLSGFTGSAGDLLVGSDRGETWLFTDSRYHLQASEELAGSGVGLQRVGEPDSKSLTEFLRLLAGRHGTECVVGYDPLLVAQDTAKEYATVLADGGACLRATLPNLVDALWRTRPAQPRTPLYPCTSRWIGRGVAEKLAALRADVTEHNATATAVVKLDQIAWLCNLRSRDEIPYTPVFEAYLYVDREHAHLFLRGGDSRLPDGWEGLTAGFAVHEYDAFPNFLRGLGPARVLVDPARTTQGVAEALAANPDLHPIEAVSPVERAKAVKDAAELEGMAEANLLASAAKVRALLWLRDRLAGGNPVTELEFSDQLQRCYAALPGYRQLAFPAIVAAGEHAAVVHYSGADATPLHRGQLLLVDSGIHVEGGTTDATRTVVVGGPSAEQRRVYTLVLKGHIAAATQIFPQGTPGAALDALARAPLWAEHLQYGHGTGHGVGALLNVHEGPFSLAPARRGGTASYGLEAGMVTSIEPGYYRPGFGGVRLESLYRVVDTGVEAEGRGWLGLEPLTWIPFEPALVDLELLDDRQRRWLAGYQQDCAARLGPHLSANGRASLEAWLGEDRNG